MDAHGRAARQAGELQIVIHAQLIQGVPALVDHAVQGGEHRVLVIMSGDAHIPFVEAVGEGMLRLPHGTVPPVQPHQSHQPVREQALPGHREIARDILRQGLFAHGPDEGDQFRAQGSEERLQLRNVQLFLIPVQAGLIGILIRPAVQRQALLDLKELLQMGREHLEIGLHLGLVPDGLRPVADRDRPRSLIRGHPFRVLKLLQEHLSLPGGFFVYLPAGGVQSHEGLPDPVIDQRVTVLPAQLFKRPAPRLAAARGGGGHGVIVHQAHSVAVSIHFRFQGFQVFQGFPYRHGCPPFRKCC